MLEDPYEHVDDKTWVLEVWSDTGVHNKNFTPYDKMFSNNFKLLY
jgi:hypothetical protein